MAGQGDGFGRLFLPRELNWHGKQALRFDLSVWRFVIFPWHYFCVRKGRACLSTSPPLSEITVQITGIQGGFKAAATASSTQSAREESARADGLFNTFDIGDTLTSNDKDLVQWDPGSGKVNQAAVALAGYRQSGAITGEVRSDFVDTLKNFIANKGGYPMNPATMMAKSGSQPPLSPDTHSALFNLLNQKGAA
jgi:hypothetical protein